MELSILLVQQIAAMFLTMAVGYAIVKIGLFTVEDSKVISNVVVYICSPCVVIDSFQIELTPDKIRGLLLSIAASVAVHILMLAGIRLAEKPLENLPLLVRRVPGGKEHGGVVALSEKLLHVLEDGGEDVVVNIGCHDGDAAASPDHRLGSNL